MFAFWFWSIVRIIPPGLGEGRGGWEGVKQGNHGGEKLPFSQRTVPASPLHTCLGLGTGRSYHYMFLPGRQPLLSPLLSPKPNWANMSVMSLTSQPLQVHWWRFNLFNPQERKTNRYLEARLPLPLLLTTPHCQHKFCDPSPNSLLPRPVVTPSAS